MTLYQLPCQTHIQPGDIVDSGGGPGHRYGKVIKVLEENYKFPPTDEPTMVMGGIKWNRQPVKLCLISGIETNKKKELPRPPAGYAWFLG
jgi:hypothetical protein